MPFISITRLRIRSIRFLPAFAFYTSRSLRQARASAGFQTGALLPDRSWTFWTMTVWDGEESMRRFMTTGDHRAAMPRLMEWCDEASVVHWETAELGLPTWSEADGRMRAEGRASKLRKPGPNHASLTYREPRVTRSQPILKR